VANLLIVDDSQVIREMTIASLRGEPSYRCEQAASGLEAIERLSLQRFDLMVLDLNMPDIGGFEVIQFVRGQDRLRRLPIVVVTTRGDEGSRGRALELGASLFMTKPFTPDGLVGAVRSLLGGAEPSNDTAP
jgi:two-component system chemotaxis response regulator CheY